MEWKTLGGVPGFLANHARLKAYRQIEMRVTKGSNAKWIETCELKVFGKTGRAPIYCLSYEKYGIRSKKRLGKPPANDPDFKTENR